MHALPPHSKVFLQLCCLTLNVPLLSHFAFISVLWLGYATYPQLYCFSGSPFRPWVWGKLGIVDPGAWKVEITFGILAFSQSSPCRKLPSHFHFQKYPALPCWLQPRGSSGSWTPSLYFSCSGPWSYFVLIGLSSSVPILTCVVGGFCCSFCIYPFFQCWWSFWGAMGRPCLQLWVAGPLWYSLCLFFVLSFSFLVFPQHPKFFFSSWKYIPKFKLILTSFVFRYRVSCSPANLELHIVEADPFNSWPSYSISQILESRVLHQLPGLESFVGPSSTVFHLSKDLNICQG